MRTDTSNLEPQATGGELARAPRAAGPRSAWLSGPLARLGRLDRGTRVLLLLFVLSVPLLTPRVAASDEIEYFSYLHSVVFDGDLNFRNEYTHFCNLDYRNCLDSRFKETFLDSHTATGLQTNFGPIGSALLWLPFYVLAHLLALALHAFDASVAADGYSGLYIGAISFGSLLYGWLGLVFSYRLARDWVPEKIALASTLAILLATNAVYYLYVQPAMSHANSLFATGLFVLYWYSSREARTRGSTRAWIILGACGALMTMVREQEGLFLLLPIAETKLRVILSGWRDRSTFLSQARSALVGLTTMSLAWLVAFSPQLLVYRTLNGNWLPARDVTQKFTWDGAHVGDVLFSNLHGLFTWTPITLFAVAGLFLLWRRDRALAALFILVFAAQVYLLGSFSTWFGGSAFGMRRFVNCTILFVLGLALLVDWLRKRVSPLLLAGGGLLLVVWNLLFIVQFATGLVPRALPVDFGVVAYNQIFVVPARLGDIAWRFVTARGSFKGK